MLANYLKKQDKSQTKEEDVVLPGLPIYILKLIFVESIVRISAGQYMFGNMKVHLRCVNGYLVGTYCKIYNPHVLSSCWRRVDAINRVLEQAF